MSPGGEVAIVYWAAGSFWIQFGHHLIEVRCPDIVLLVSSDAAPVAIRPRAWRVPKTTSESSTKYWALDVFRPTVTWTHCDCINIFKRRVLEKHRVTDLTVKRCDPSARRGTCQRKCRANSRCIMVRDPLSTVNMSSSVFSSPMTATPTRPTAHTPVSLGSDF